MTFNVIILFVMNSAQLSSLNFQFLGLVGGIVVFLIVIFFLSFITKIAIRLGLVHTEKPPIIVAISLILLFSYIALMRNIISSAGFIIPTDIASLTYPSFGLLFTFGLWNMNKWGLFGLITITCLLQVFYIFSRMWTPVSLIYFTPLLPGLFYFKKMS